MATLAAAILGLALFSGSAGAAFTATGWSLVPTTTQAGAHPGISMKAATDPAAADLTGDDLSSLQLDLPAGLLMNPQAVGTPCPTANFNTDSCAASTQVGNLTVSYRVSGKLYTSTGSIYSITPDSNSLINFGFVVRPSGFSKLFFTSGRATGLATVRQGLDKDYGLSILVPNIPRTIKSTLGFSTAMTIGSIQMDFFARSGSTQTGPYFVYNPTRCDAANSKATFTSYAGVTQSQSGGFVPTGCSQVKFDPSFAITGSNTNAGQATGLAATVTMPTAEQAIQQTDVQGVTVYLPSGMTINLGVLNNTALCTDTQLAADSCPSTSRIGSANVNVPMLPAAMTGDIYLQQRELPTKFAYVLRGARGTVAMLRGSVDLGSSGLIATLQTLPQVPWSSATLNFTSLVLNNPRNACPSTAAWGDITGWNGSESIIGTLMPQTNCPPDTTITSSPSSPTNYKTPQFSFSSNPAGATFQCSLDNAAFAACASPFVSPTLTEGPHTFAVRAVGSTGLADPTPASVDFTVDLTPPPINFSSPSAGATLTSSTVNLAFTTEPGATNYCRLDNLGINECVGSYAFTDVADGAHKIRVISRDVAGNISYKDLAFTVAVVRPPVVTISSPADGSTLATNDVTIQFNASSPNSAAITKTLCTFYAEYPEYDFEIQQGDPFPCSPGKKLRLDERQLFRLQVDVTDANGNTATASSLFTTAIHPPGAPRVINNVSLGRLTNRQPEFDLETGETSYPDATWECGLAPTGQAPAYAPCGSEAAGGFFIPEQPMANGSWTFWTRSKSGAIVGDASQMKFTVGDWSAHWSAATSTTAAGAHPDLDIDITPDQAGLWQTVDVTLPRGLVGSLNSFPKCPLDNVYDATCGSSSKIGSVSVDYQIAGFDRLAYPAVGEVYLTEPQDPTDTAGMVIRVHAPIRPFADVIIPLRLVMTDNAQRMRVFSDSIPTVVGDIYDPFQFTAFWVNDFKMHINGSAGSPYPLLTNPAQCGGGEFNGTFGDTEGNVTPDLPLSYTASDCASLPFAPTVTQQFSSLAAGTKSGVVTDVAIPAGNSSARTITVNEPAQMAPNYPAFGGSDDRCPGSAAPDADGRFDESQCPPQSEIGTISVDTPLLPEPLEGTVYLVNKTPLPWLGVALDGQGIRARFFGATDLVKVNPSCTSASCAKRISVTFDGLPDLPLTGIHMDLNRPDRPKPDGTGTLQSKLFTLAAKGDSSCVAAGSVDSVFTPASGTPPVSATQAVSVSGC